MKCHQASIVASHRTKWDGLQNRRAPTTTDIFLKTKTLYTFDEMPPGFDCSQPSNEMGGIQGLCRFEPSI